MEVEGRIRRDGYKRTVITVQDVDPEFCQHDWRITNKDCIALGEALVECLHCHRSTAVEFHPDWNDLETCPRYTGQV